MPNNCIKVLLSFVIAVLVTAPFPAVAGNKTDGEKDSVQSRQSGLFPLPILFYSPETGIAGGGAVMYLYRNPHAARASAVSGDIIYTQKKQIIVEFSGDQYFDVDTYRLLSSITFQKFPNKFFGIGNSTASGQEESYTPKSFSFRTALYRNVYSKFSAGPLIRFESVSLLETKPSGLLATGNILGSNGGTSAALGFVANWDSRDNTFAATSGSFHQLTTLFYRSAFGSDYSYTDIQLETRDFFELLPRQILALQVGAEFIDGSAPFQSLVKFGGPNLLRGYFDGRYRDKNGVAAQTEYRFPVWGRFGAVAFAGVAQVADEITRFGMNRFWFAGGLGLRFFWNPEERISLRLDYGIGNNSSGMYITVTEAF